MKMSKKEKVTRLIDRFLWIFAICFAAFIPVSGVVADYIPKASVFSLGFACLFAVAFLCKIILNKNLGEYFRRDVLMFLLFFSTTIITAVKYAYDILYGSNSTFFSYFAIPAYMAGMLSISLWLREKKGRIYELMQAYSAVFCLVFLIFNNRYILDVGGVVRAVGNYSNPNEMSIYAFCSLACSIALIWARQYSVIINLVLSAVSVSALLLSQSRTGFIAIIVGVAAGVFVAVLGLKKANLVEKRKNRKATLCRIVASLGSLGILVILFFQILSPNLLTITDIRGDDYTYVGRVELIRAYPQLREPLEKLLKEMDPPSEEDYFENGMLPDYTDPDMDTMPGSKDPDNALKNILLRLVYGNGTDESGVLSNLRYRIWLGYLINIKDFWLFGAENGFASIAPVLDNLGRACHNTFLYLFVQYGIIVVGLFAALFLRLLKTLVLTRKENSRKVPYAGMLVGLPVFLMFNDLVNVAAFWLVLAILGAAANQTTPSSPKTVAIVRRYGGFGGIEHQIISICEGLSARGTQVHLITDQESDFSEKAGQFGANVVLMRLNNPLFSGVKLAKYCRENNVDILQSHMFFESVICRVARFVNSSAKHIYRIHTYIDCSHISRHKKNLYHILSFVTNSFVDLYLPINDYNRQEMLSRSLLPSDKILVVHDGVKAPGEPYDRSPKEKAKIAMVANFVAFKGHDILIEGLDILRSRGIFLQAYLYGGCPKDESGNEDTSVLEEIKAMVISKGLQDQVHFCGYTTDIRKSLEDVWALVLPSYSEGTPNCVLEAMSLKVLTVCSDVGGVKEFLADGVTGYLHTSEDAFAFADAVVCAMEASDSKNNEILDRAYEVWQNDYSVQNMVDGIADSYN